MSWGVYRYGMFVRTPIACFGILQLHRRYLWMVRGGVLIADPGFSTLHGTQ